MREFVSGAEVIARAAIDAGCNFFAGYPITPATGILIQLMRLLPQAGGIAVQGEDEIASIGFCIGAASAGRKVLTATSGPGMSLYSENIGFAQMAEIPLVIVNVQRMGPATGGATTMAEGDVMFSRYATSGGYPLIVLSPTNLEETYTLTIRAFNLAERFRTPVILSTCKDLVMGKESADVELYEKPPLVERICAKNKDKFLPYGFVNRDDVPPFAAIGGDIITRVNTSTHDKMGLLTKDPKAMDEALRHLNDKIMMHADEIEDVKGDIEDGADVIIVAYGLAARSAMEVVRQSRKSGKKVSLAVVRSLWPLPEKALVRLVGSHSRIIVPEHNLGQYASEIERLFPNKKVIRINRVDGEPISPEDVDI